MSRGAPPQFRRKPWAPSRALEAEAATSPRRRRVGVAGSPYLMIGLELLDDLREETVTLRNPGAEVFRDSLPDVGERGADTQVHSPARALAISQQRHVLAAVIGG